MNRVEKKEPDLREVYRKEPGEDLMVKLSADYILFLRRYYPLRFLRMLSKAGFVGAL